MMQHTSHTRTLMLDWLKDRDERVLPSPSDEEIMEKFSFASPEAARTLLADLADRGQISVRGTGDHRQINIGKPKPPRIATPAVLRSVKRPATKIQHLDEDAGVSRIMDIVRRSKVTAASVEAPTANRPVAHIAAPAVEPAVAPEATRTAAAAPIGLAAVEPAKRKRELAASPTPQRRQVNIKVSEEHYQLLSERAEAQDLYLSTLVSDMFASLLDRETAPTQPAYKPLVRAHVIRAAREAGIPLEEFVPSLIEAGLERFLAANPEGIAA